MNTADLKSFYYLENGEVSFSMYDTIKAVKKLDPGVYNIYYLDDYPNSRVVIETNQDKESIKIHQFPDKDKIEVLINSFFNKNVVLKMNALGFYNKIGVLLWGAEGTGKSTIIKYYSRKLVADNNAIVFYFNHSGHRFKDCWNVIYKLRKIQPNPIVVIFEEIDGQIKENYSNLKTVLDGHLSIDNSIIFATTNYIDDIPSTLKDRPSRFKYSINIEGIQSHIDVQNIVSKMIGDVFSEKEIYDFANELKGKSLDVIKQFCVDKIMDLKTYSIKKKMIGFFK